MYYEEPTNLEAAQRLIVAYQRLGLGQKEDEHFEQRTSKLIDLIREKRFSACLSNGLFESIGF